MKSLPRCILAIGTAMVLAGCGSHNAPNVLPGEAPFGQSQVETAHSNAASSGDLLYISASYKQKVLAYRYPHGGRAPIFRHLWAILAGECADTEGNVYIIFSNFSGAGFVYEYPHGKASLMRQYLSYDIYDSQCSVDPTSGDLAVTTGTAHNGLFLVFPNRAGKPKNYTLPQGFDSQTCSYDNNGNLFINGGAFPQPALFELPKGAKKVVNITLPAMNGLKKAAGAIRWDGKYLAFADAEHTVYLLAISGTKARIAGRVRLDGVKHIENIWIEQNSIAASSPGEVLVWKYPAGGRPIRTINLGAYDDSDGVAVSVPSHRIGRPLTAKVFTSDSSGS